MSTAGRPARSINATCTTVLLGVLSTSTVGNTSTVCSCLLDQVYLFLHTKTISLYSSLNQRNVINIALAVGLIGAISGIHHIDNEESLGPSMSSPLSNIVFFAKHTPENRTQAAKQSF